jgi:hypothetical protein
LGQEPYFHYWNLQVILDFHESRHGVSKLRRRFNNSFPNSLQQFIASFRLPARIALKGGERTDQDFAPPRYFEKERKLLK